MDTTRKKIVHILLVIVPFIHFFISTKTVIANLTSKNFMNKMKGPCSDL